ncbi:hypothetical protein A3I46_01210 [Candidatus Kaiserbacteria bacterium RIFCSPLOWO2_02_FULL_54_13]|uniref:Glycosyl transferase family 1 domain-containing protein n=1 Tax=Candidatus Kaiserbacteria bacterium RIFCSPHIGHO2_02_FULL_54_22 TaxID=1798495 RepID=A0A1F6DJ56_9BACT|nr:MAG: hypothetical protein A3C19_01695 [Candidatus Kaiserbacteria bacterium RIFCSPHIGHO2_02_FULL_54_22]OGG68551.1 MAG: hypothetical protein A3E99_00205 [Candidatus Kaiserbacteria bacterium RIFCSPHIGHO2_12_FULL_54_16]OGG83954.1 MAG: hypothetical protein A3I46_01210 [Candidatus Kaiserbacteria bacterium RIFCSPLOWO2_02_FULL_54_13]OGG89917.1 MAG: hypothetical protein A3G12_01590 [Candidatus Kaiserbacteria bacterium RIFCSPLOWO2_12_FULL_54_10]
MERQRSLAPKPGTIHFYTFSDIRSSSSRPRAFCVADELRARGLSTVIHTPPVLLISRTHWPGKWALIVEVIRSLFSIKKGDVVYLQRAIANKYFLIIMVAYLFISRRKMIFDIDDPVYVHSFFKTMVLTRMADLVIVSSHAQVEWARQYNNNVHLIHITVNHAAYKKFTKQYSQNSAPVVIGWTGAANNHIPNLKILASVLRMVVGETKVPFTFVLIGASRNKEVHEMFQHIPGLAVEIVDWVNPENILLEIQKFDIGVVPNRIDGEWNTGKQSYKLIEYMACGLAIVASAFGEVPYVIQDGMNGYLAHTEEEFAEKLEKLLSDPALRARLGHAAQERIRTEYCFEVVIPRMIELINAVAQR